MKGICRICILVSVYCTVKSISVNGLGQFSDYYPNQQWSDRISDSDNLWQPPTAQINNNLKRTTENARQNILNYPNLIIFPGNSNINTFDSVRRKNVARINGNNQQQPYQYLSQIVFPHAEERKTTGSPRQPNNEGFLPNLPNSINEQAMDRNVQYALEVNHESREKIQRSPTTFLQPIIYLNSPNIENSNFQSNQPRQVIYIDENGIFQVRDSNNIGGTTNRPTTTEAISTFNSDAIIFELDDNVDSYTADLRQNRQIDESKFYPTSNQSKDDWFIFT